MNSNHYLTACIFFVTTVLVSMNVIADMSSYVISARRLSQIQTSPELIIWDVRDPASYEKGHIPGAINVAWETFAMTDGQPGKGWGVVLPKNKLAIAFAKAGINNNSRMVVYADPKNGWGEDGRFLWMLRLAGHQNSQWLDGGLAAWKASGQPISTTLSTAKPNSYTIHKLDTDLVADTKWITAHQKAAKILDARKKNEFDGAVEFGEARGGRIPGALHFHFRQVYNPNGTLKSAKKIVAMFQQMGLKKTDDIVIYCTAGIRSAHLTMILHMTGFNKARNYDEAFYWWAADEKLPLE